MSIAKAPSLDQLTHSQWSQPSFTLPTPSLTFLFHLECDMESFRHIGKGPNGDRSTVIFKVRFFYFRGSGLTQRFTQGGRFEGPKLRGTILPGGGDWEIVQDRLLIQGNPDEADVA